MKPNDQAYQAALRATSDSCSAYQIQNALDAAYAAQLPPSEDYAELIETLRSSSPYTLSHVAADALEAVLAERDALKAELAAANKRAANRLAVEAERDALLARLVPVDDKALVEIARQAILKETGERVGLWPTILVAVIAAIRPHIEAAERERIANQTENWSRNPAFQLLATAIRSGK